MITSPQCPHCHQFVYLDTLVCPNCEAELGYYLPGHEFVSVRKGQSTVDGRTWFTCSNRIWQCNWLVAEDEPSGQCFSCRLTRTRPSSADTVAMSKWAATEEPKRRLVLQLREMQLPITPWYQQEGGLGFDLLSSIELGRKVIIGHADGIITIDLAESLAEVREALRVRLGEPYRTMLGHLRHEVGHYYQNVLLTSSADWARCRELFGDERASYQEALDRHYATGAPEGWRASFISEYATMHPWEDFAETFAHYMHITSTLYTAAATGMRLVADRIPGRKSDVVPNDSYADQPVQELLVDWKWLSQAFNRINRSMGQDDLYPFELPLPVQRKLGFVHELVVRPDRI